LLNKQLDSEYSVLDYYDRGCIPEEEEEDSCSDSFWWFYGAGFKETGCSLKREVDV
jgi:hypothetical protein